MAYAVLKCCKKIGPLGVLSRHLKAFRNDNTDGKTFRWTPAGWCPSEKGGDNTDLRQVKKGIWVSGELSGPWEDYFDDSSVEEIGYPPPLTPQFSMSYKEPVVDFVSESTNLLKIVRSLFDPFSENELVIEGTKDHNAFLTSSKPLIVMNDDGELTCRWLRPSLLDA